MPDTPSCRCRLCGAKNHAGLSIHADPGSPSTSLKVAHRSRRDPRRRGGCAMPTTKGEKWKDARIKRASILPPPPHNLPDHFCSPSFFAPHTVDCSQTELLSVSSQLPIRCASCISGPTVFDIVIDPYPLPLSCSFVLAIRPPRPQSSIVAFHRVLQTQYHEMRFPRC